MSAAPEPWYPVFWNLRGRPVLVIGGGPLAAEKVRGLRAAQAEITIAAASLCAELRSAVEEGAVRWTGRAHERGGMAGCAIVMAATGDAAENAALFAEARECGVPINAADDPAHCDFILPAVVRDPPVTLAVSTGGASPAIARRLRGELSDFLAEDAGGLTALVGEARADLRRLAVFAPIPAQAWQDAIDGRLRALIAQRRRGQAKALLLARLGAGLWGDPAEHPSLLASCGARRGDA